MSTSLFSKRLIRRYRPTAENCREPKSRTRPVIIQTNARSAREGADVACEALRRRISRKGSNSAALLSMGGPSIRSCYRNTPPCTLDAKEDCGSFGELEPKSDTQKETLQGVQIGL